MFPYVVTIHLRNRLVKTNALWKELINQNFSEVMFTWQRPVFVETPGKKVERFLYELESGIRHAKLGENNLKKIVPSLSLYIYIYIYIYNESNF